MSYLSVLDHPPNMLSVVQKRPQYLQNKRRDNVGKMRRNSNHVMKFSDLVGFVQLASDTANDPVYGKVTTTTGSVQDGKITKRANVSKSTNFAVNADTNVACQMCKGKHDLDDCKQFLTMPVNERRSYLQQNNLCFACYDTGHTSKGCLHKRTCKICGKRHPSALHIDNFVFQSTKSLQSGNAPRYPMDGWMDESGL